MMPTIHSAWRRTSCWGLGLLICLSTIASAFAQEASTAQRRSPGLAVTPDGSLVFEGRPFRGIGVNYFDAFYRTLRSPKDLSYKDGMRYLQGKRIPFIRFMASAYWPGEYRLYLTDKEKYFALLDEFVRTAESHGIGLIPSLFWNATAIPDLVGEPVNQWGNPRSKTIAFMQRYTGEVVSRYKDSPAIWGWEFGNEMNAYADLLDQAGKFRPQVNPENGTPSQRTVDDEITTDHLRVAYVAFAHAVREHDGTRILMSGNDIPPPNAGSRYRESRWDKDSRSGYLAMLQVQNPDPLNMISIHLYPHRESAQYGGASASLNDIIEMSMAAAHSSRKPLFIGEFGAPSTLGREQERKKFTELLDGIERLKVPLAALWVFDFSAQDKEWNVIEDNERSYQLEQISRFNQRARVELGL